MTNPFKLTPKHIELYKLISKRGIGRSCNDLNPHEESVLDNTEWQTFSKAYHDWNGDPEEYSPQHSYMMDFMIVNYIQHLLVQHYVDTGR